MTRIRYHHHHHHHKWNNRYKIEVIVVIRIIIMIMRTTITTTTICCCMIQRIQPAPPPLLLLPLRQRHWRKHQPYGSMMYYVDEEKSIMVRLVGSFVFVHSLWLDSLLFVSDVPINVSMQLCVCVCVCVPIYSYDVSPTIVCIFHTFHSHHYYHYHQNICVTFVRTAGNAYFRQVVAEALPDFKLFQSQKNRHGMSMVVQRIVQHVHDTGGRFMDQNWRGMVRDGWMASWLVYLVAGWFYDHSLYLMTASHVFFSNVLL